MQGQNQVSEQVFTEESEPLEQVQPSGIEGQKQASQKPYHQILNRLSICDGNRDYYLDHSIFEANRE
jgi:hypothetical protein